MKITKSIRLNTIANLVGLAYSTLINVTFFPLYLDYLGAEAFGLVGFFTVLQAWTQLLDMGMSPMLSRQTAYFRGQGTDFTKLKKLLRSLELIILFIAIFVISTITINSKWIAYNWLNVATLDLKNITYSISLMGWIVALGLFSSLYRSGIRGMEEQVWLNLANIVLITLKFVGSFLLLLLITREFVDFFVYQLVVAIIELLILGYTFYHFIQPASKVGITFFWNIIKPFLPFAGGIAYTAGIWILLTQTDKLILSKILPLSKYGYFALVTVASGGIIQVSGAISQAILPRMTNLFSRGNEKDLLKLYRASTQYMAIVILPLSGVIALFSHEFIFAWTGNQMASEWAAPILLWFALGNGILSITAFQYYLQFAHGNIKMHIIYNSITACIQIPVIIYTAFHFGAEGVAFVWFLLRTISFIVWTPIVHHKFAAGMHRQWLTNDILPVLSSTSLTLIFFRIADINFNLMNRISIFLTLIAIGIIIIMINLICSTTGRKHISIYLEKRRINSHA